MPPAVRYHRSLIFNPKPETSKRAAGLQRNVKQQHQQAIHGMLEGTHTSQRHALHIRSRTSDTARRGSRCASTTHAVHLSRLELNTTGTEGRATRTRTPTETYRKLEEQTVHIHTYVFFKHVHEYVCAICLCAHVCVSQCINPETPYLQVE